MKTISVFAAIVAMSLSATAASAQSATQNLKPVSKSCVDMGQVEAILAEHPEFKNLRRINSSHLEVAVALYNSTPPESKSKWDAAYLLDGPENTGALIVGRRGKLCNVLVLSPPYWRALVKTVEGDPS